MAEAKPVQHFADRAFMKNNAKSPRNQVTKIDTAPAYDALIGNMGTLLHDPGEFGFLPRCQPGFRSRSLGVDKSVDAIRIVAMHPVTQRLPIHSAHRCRVRTRGARYLDGKGQQPPSLIGMLRPGRFPP